MDGKRAESTASSRATWHQWKQAATHEDQEMKKKARYTQRGATVTANSTLNALYKNHCGRGNCA